jgi:hypothetical protein
MGLLEFNSFGPPGREGVTEEEARVKEKDEKVRKSMQFAQS